MQGSGLRDRGSPNPEVDSWFADARIDASGSEIRNDRLLLLLALALAIATLSFTKNRDAGALLVTAAIAAAMFALLAVFWLLGKVGAGDVKLMAIVPLLVGVSGSMPFVLSLLAISFVVYFVSRFPSLLPKRWFRNYLEFLERTGRVPYGVPISAAAIVAVVIGAWA